MGFHIQHTIFYASNGLIKKKKKRDRKVKRRERTKFLRRRNSSFLTCIIVTAQDAVGCKASFNISLPQPDPLSVNVNVESQLVCTGDSAYLSVDVTGMGGSMVNSKTTNSIGILVKF